MTRRAAWLLPVLTGVLVVLALGLRFGPGGIALWADTLYPLTSRLWVPLTERGAVPWTPVLAALLLVVVGQLVRAASSRRVGLAVLVSVPLLLGSTFALGWGLHAWREPVEVRLGFEADRVDGAPALTVAEAQALSDALVQIIVDSQPTGDFRLDDANAAVVTSVATFSPTVRLPVNVKRVPGWLFGSLGVAGMVSPWTLEVHVDRGLPGWSQTAVAAHEWAHLAGFASEAGAELVGLLAGLRADHPHARYAAALRAWSSLPASVRSFDALPVRAQEDLREAQLASGRQVRWLSRMSWGVYERFLRAQGQPEGLAGYGRGVVLLQQARRAGLW